MRNRIRTRITVALATTFTAIALSPLETMAEPQAVWLPAECGVNANVELKQGNKSPSIFDSTFIQSCKITSTLAQDVERRAGCELTIKGLTKPVRGEGGSGGFQEAEIVFRVPNDVPNNSITPDDLVANFHFKNQGLASKTFRQLGITTLKPGTWQRVTAKQAAVGIGNNDLMARLVFFVRTTVKTRTVAVDFGDVNVLHKNEAGLADGFVIRKFGDCDDLDL